MRNPITRLFRYLRREHPAMAVTMTGGGIFGALLSTGMFMSGAGIPLFAIPLITAGTSGVGWLANLGIGDSDRWNDGSARINGVKIVGSKKDVASVKMAQGVITSITEKYKHLPELPVKAQRKIMAHVKDIEPALARIRVYEGWGDKQQTQFTFVRAIFDTNGRETTQNVATALAMGAVKPAEVKVVEEKKEVPVPVVTPAPVAAVKPAGAEFDKLSKKVEAMEKRIDGIENPPVEPLDKPKLAVPKN